MIPRFFPVFTKTKENEMVPWWGVLVACVLFGIWTVICFMVGAAVKDTVIKKEQQMKQNPRTN